MLDDQMQEGYHLAEAGREAEACDVWWPAWEVLRDRFSPEMRTVQQATSLLSGLQILGNWLQDFEMHLGNAARHDRRFAEMGKRFCEEWLGQFTEDKGDEQVAMRRALADFLSRLGRADEAIAVRRATVERWPREPWGYIALSDACAHRFGSDSGVPLDLAQARLWLEQGVAAVPAADPSYGVFKERLAALRAQERGQVRGRKKGS